MIKKLLFATLIFLNVYVAHTQVDTPPTLSNFRIENSNNNRVYFDSSEQITASTTSGFTVSGKNISSITINSGEETGHYFTVNSAFTFWDNNTIRFEGGSNLQDGQGNGLYNFTLTHIVNNINEPSTSKNIYVNSSASGSNNGTTESNAFTSLRSAVASISGGGNRILVKAGNYSGENVKLPSSGNPDAPNVIEGYKTTPGDISSNYYSYTPLGGTPALNRNEMPVFTGSSRESSGGIFIENGSDWIIKNIQVQNYNQGMVFDSAYDVLIENVNIINIGSTKIKEHEGYGISFYDWIQQAGNFRVKNTIVINATGDAFYTLGNFSLFENCEAYTNEYNSADAVLETTDYYFVSQASNNIFKNCIARKDTPTGAGHNGHGFSIKGLGNQSLPNEYNLVTECLAVNILGAFQLRHPNTRFNVIKNSEAHANVPNRTSGSNNTSGIEFLSGNSDNIIENMYIHHVDNGVNMVQNSENPSSVVAENTIIRNSVITNVEQVFRFGTVYGSCSVEDILFYNNTVISADNLNWMDGSGISVTMDLTNNILNDVNRFNRSSTINGQSFSNTNIYNSWANSLGSNSINENPQFDSEFTPTNKALKAGIPLSKVPYDARKEIRSSVSPTMGAFEIVDERLGSVVPDMSICKGENAILIASGGTSYEWNTGESTASITVSPTESTTYTVTISNGIDSDSHNVIVTVNEAPTVDAGSDVSLCSGEAITLTANGIGDFLWSNGETTTSITVSPTETTTYSVTAGNSCSTEVTDDVIVTVTPGINLTTTDDIEVCVGETDIILTADSNGDYLWSTGETTPTITVSPTSTTTYTVTSILGDCSKTDEIVITVNEAPTVDAGSDVSLCSGETITLTANGIGDFLWSNGETTASITVSPTETITYSVTAGNSCSIEVSDDVIVTVIPGIDLTTTDDIEVCVGETDIILTADSNGDYLWSTGETTSTITVSPTSTTTYTVTSILGDCSKTDEIVVTVNEAPTVDAGSDVSLCSGEAITLTANGIGEFLWSNGETTASITVSPTETTTYSVIASNSCSDPVSDEVIVNVTPAITLDAGIDVTICSGESTTLTATSNGALLWSTGETSDSIVVNPSTTTTYSVTSSSGECSLTDEVIVTVNNFPSVSLGEDTKICLGESVTLTAVGAGNFLWNTGETTSSIIVNPTVSTTYSVTASTSCSDPVTDEIIVIVNELPVVDAGSDVTIANGSSTVLTATGEGNFLWSTGETSSSITVSPTATTTYTVTLTSLDGCSSQDNIIVNVTDNSETTVNVDAVPDQNICLDESVTLLATGGNYYLWSTGETTSSIIVSPTETTIYAVTISNGSTVDVVDITIFVDETCSGIANRPNDKESKLYPNPTQGQLNIELAGFNDESNISVFDLNGRLVYSENIDNYSPIKVLKRQINLSRFGKGIYFVRLLNNNKSETKKILVI